MSEAPVQRPFANTARKTNTGGVFSLAIWDTMASVQAKRKYEIILGLEQQLEIVRNVVILEKDTNSQKLPPRLTWKTPTIRPPVANPKLVGRRMEPAADGDQAKTAIA